MKDRPKAVRNRSLDHDVPELREYLFPGARVLDVACGNGSITMDVADAVKPGEVTGVARVAKDLTNAFELHEERSYVDNVTFQVSDAHSLDFRDNTFDIVYSHTVMHFLLDPVASLKEQRRVAKKGGWVIASGVRDYRLVRRYPECPAWEAVWDAVKIFYNNRLQEYVASGKTAAQYTQYLSEQNPSFMVYADFHSGTKCAGWFSKAGLADLEVRVKPDYVHFASKEGAEKSFLDILLPSEDDDESPGWQQRTQDFEVMIKKGLLDEQTLDSAEKEARQWYQNEDAFFFYPLIWVAGRA